MRYLLLLTLCAGCHTVTIETPEGYKYSSKQPAFSKKMIKSVSLRHQENGDLIFDMEGYNNDVSTGYVEAVKVMSDALVKATPPTP